MPTYYLHFILAHQAIDDTILADECRSAFLLGALAPDANNTKQDKIRSHYSIHVGLTWGHRIRAFEREFLHNQAHASAQHWFYRGYRYHLSLDQAWTRAVSRRAILRMINGQLGGHPECRALYRSEQAQFDAYHRFRIESSVLQISYHCLVRADRYLVPGFLVLNRLDAIVEGLSACWSRPAVSSFQGKIIRLRDVERFMRRVSHISV